jgi:hypothetical protein
MRHGVLGSQKRLTSRPCYQAGRTKFPFTGAGFCVKLRSKCTSDSCSTRAHGYLMGTSDDCRASKKELAIDSASPQAEAPRCFESHRVHRKDIEFHVKRFFCFIRAIIPVFENDRS